MIRSVLTKLLAVGMLAALAAAIGVYPLNKLVLALPLAAYAAALWWRPALWLLVVPALLPVLDLAPWTGWFFLEELDLVLLTTVAVGYWRLGTERPMAVLPPFAKFSLSLVACSFATAAGIGLLPLAPLDANAFSNYLSHYNSLRVVKGFAWSLMLLPLLLRSLGQGLVNLRRYFVPGMLLGLAGASLAVVWERSVFPGLFNFASDYRPTAPFSAMHTGGAALDAYLGMAFPFVALWLLDTRSHLHSHLRTGLAMLLLLLGCYAGFAMFSRDIYLAYASSGLIVVALGISPILRQGKIDIRLVAATCVLLAVLGYVLAHVFASSGYRGLAASLVLLVASVIMATTEERMRHLPLFAAGALLLMALDAGLFLAAQSNAAAVLAKGPYLGFLLSASLFSLGALQLFFGGPTVKSVGLAIAAAGFPGVALATGLVAYHWGGEIALPDIACLVVLAFLLVALNRLLPQPIWRPTRRTLTATFFFTIVFATAIPVFGSYYLGSRMSTVGDDFSVRLRHWREALEMMTPDWKSEAFGMGLGRYPETYLWKNSHGEMPSTFSYRQEDNNLFLRLGTPQYAIGYGEVLRMLQHVDIKPGSGYRFSVDVRRPAGNGELGAAICERWLLYPENCVNVPVRLVPADNAWHHYEVPIESGHLGGRLSLLHVPIQLEISAWGKNTYVDVDNVSLQEFATGAELVRNGSFSNANDYWFFSSDRNHFPWHVKNFFVNMVFEQGWVGLCVLALFLLYVLGELFMRGLHRDRTAAVFLASLTGCLLIGMFDSIFDVPRLTLLFFLIALAGLSHPYVERRPRAMRGAGTSSTAVRKDPTA